MESTINLSNKKEFFWDNYLVDESLTTAEFDVCHPVKKEVCFSFDFGKEKDYTISYPCILKDEKGYKCYYLVWKSSANYNVPRAYMAVIESKDGITWHRPTLNIVENVECNAPNMLVDNLFDGLTVFIDNNPACDKNEKYKAVGVYYPNGTDKRSLWYFASPDGYNFTLKNMITDKGFFDSLNTVIFRNGEYACYMRDYHKPFDNPDGKPIRDIRVTYSKDFINWTEPQLIEFTDGLDEPLYTNNVQIYPNSEHMLIGFPVRYTERQEWTSNMEQIASANVKKDIMKKEEAREGLAVTDSIFMCSRDGKLWHRYNEAFLSPSYEGDNNWVYGDCYLAYNLIDTDTENFYLYSHECHRSRGLAKPFYRYEMRKDGFACIKAKAKESVVVTKPLTFTGKDLHINFTTSAKGYIYVDVLDKDGNVISDTSSFEIFGDNINRKISFLDGSDFSKYQNQEIRLRFRMSDAKLYSMWFE